MSRSEKKQPGALVGEKSQSVYSANWKLDEVLKRELQMLDTSKRRVTHRISLDQRVVQMRFQKKLHRSKVYHARMTENKEMLRDLLHHDNYNFQNYRNEDNTTPAFKRKTPSRAKSARPSTCWEEKGQVLSNKKKSLKGGITPAATPVTFEELGKKVSPEEKLPDTIITEGEAGKSTGAVLEKQDENPSNDKEQFNNAASVPIDTTVEPAVEKDKIQTETKHVTPDAEAGNKTSKEVRVVDDEPPRVSVIRKSTFSATVRTKMTNPMDREGLKNRPKTAIGTMPSADNETSVDPTNETDPEHDLSKEEPNSNPSDDSQLKRPQSTVSFGQIATSVSKAKDQLNMLNRRKSSPAAGKHGMPSIFGEEKRPTILELNEERIRRANYSERVKQFVNNVDTYSDPENVDYYALRLAENCSIRANKKTYNFEKSEFAIMAEKDEAKRSVGNLNAKNMTFRSVKKPF